MSSDRILNDWITAYLKYTENTEPPKSYHTWVAISIIAGALQRKVYCRWGFDTIYPNMYIVLIGASGRCRKGTAMRLGREILKQVSIPITSETVTREALIRTMSESCSNYTDRTTNVIKFQCALTAFSEELSVFLGQNDLKFLSNLTDWYDSADDWENKTKNKGTDKLQGVCFNLLGATAPDWLQSILPQEAIGGGFTSRIIFVVAEKKGKTIEDPKFTKEEQELQKMLVSDLNKIVNISGEMSFEPEARQAYMSWYVKTEKEAEQGNHAVADPRFGGYCDRRATHIKKLSMILSASRGSSRLITLEDFNRAKQILEATETMMPKAFGGLGKSKYSDAVETILDYLIIRRKCKRSEIMTTFRRDIDPQTLLIVEKVLTDMKVMRIEVEPQQDERIYIYIGPT